MKNILLEKRSRTKNGICGLKEIMTRKNQLMEEKKTSRQLNLSPQKILDAPDLKDDYYLNLLDWNSKGTLSIGLG